MEMQLAGAIIRALEVQHNQYCRLEDLPEKTMKLSRLRSRGQKRVDLATKMWEVIDILIKEGVLINYFTPKHGHVKLGPDYKAKMRALAVTSDGLKSS